MPEKHIRIYDEENDVYVCRADIKEYKKGVDGVRYLYWFLILESHMSRAEVDDLTLEEMYEAVAALELFAEAKEKAAKEAMNG